MARYESVTVLAPDSTFSIAVLLSLAFDATTDELYCAFTDPARHWARTTLPPQDVQASATEDGRLWSPAPVRYQDLRSTIPDVLHALWKITGVSPSKTGQVIVRPRFVVNNVKHEVNGQWVPENPPCNVWIVEVLGTRIMERHGALLTTLVLQIRDGDLKELPGSIGP